MNPATSALSPRIQSASGWEGGSRIHPALRLSPGIHPRAVGLGTFPERLPPQAPPGYGLGMIVQAWVRDCLFLNWALPTSLLPPPPRALRHQRHAWEGEDHTFVSALLFHHVGVHVPTFPRVRFSY